MHMDAELCMGAARAAGQQEVAAFSKMPFCSSKPLPHGLPWPAAAMLPPASEVCTSAASTSAGSDRSGWGTPNSGAATNSWEGFPPVDATSIPNGIECGCAGVQSGSASLAMAHVSPQRQVVEPPRVSPPRVEPPRVEPYVLRDIRDGAAESTQKQLYKQREAQAHNAELLQKEAKEALLARLDSAKEALLARLEQRFKLPTGCLQEPAVAPSVPSSGSTQVQGEKQQTRTSLEPPRPPLVEPAAPMSGAASASLANATSPNAAVSSASAELLTAIRPVIGLAERLRDCHGRVQDPGAQAVLDQTEKNACHESFERPKSAVPPIRGLAERLRTISEQPVHPILGLGERLRFTADQTDTEPETDVRPVWRPIERLRDDTAQHDDSSAWLKEARDHALSGPPMEYSPRVDYSPRFDSEYSPRIDVRCAGSLQDDLAGVPSRAAPRQPAPCARADSLAQVPISPRSRCTSESSGVPPPEDPGAVAPGKGIAGSRAGARLPKGSSREDFREPQLDAEIDRLERRFQKLQSQLSASRKAEQHLREELDRRRTLGHLSPRTPPAGGAWSPRTGCPPSLSSLSPGGTGNNKICLEFSGFA